MPKVKKPRCAEVIIATIRKLRRTPPGAAAGTASGMAVSRIWPVIREFYSESEFREGVEESLQNGTLLATWQFFDRECGSGFSRKRIGLVTSVPLDFPLKGNIWQRNYLGENLDLFRNRLMIPNSNQFSDLRLYVLADGLPKNIAKLIEKSVQQIIVDMQKN